MGNIDNLKNKQFLLALPSRYLSNTGSNKIEVLKTILKENIIEREFEYGDWAVSVDCVKDIDDLEKALIALLID